VSLQYTVEPLLDRSFLGQTSGVLDWAELFYTIDGSRFILINRASALGISIRWVGICTSTSVCPFILDRSTDLARGT
jgi:hypothetical protein